MRAEQKVVIQRLRQLAIEQNRTARNYEDAADRMADEGNRVWALTIAETHRRAARAIDGAAKALEIEGEG